ncbi:cytochrome P450 2K6-like isoform X3 [Ahaetulla prasina]|nr:cytochrome P450 2K6-like isoform X3 [Ahaetulla prasina]
MVVLTGYETIKEALVNQADVFADRPFVPIFEDTTKGFGLVFARGESWKVMRQFTLSTLREYGMGKRTIEDKITEECSVLMKTMETYAGKPFDVTTILTAAVSNIIVSILLGQRYEYEDTKFLQLLKIMSENIRISGSPAVLLYNLFPKLGFLLSARKIIMKNQKKLHDFIQTTFIEYLQDLDENDQRNFIESFLVQQREENMKMRNGGYFHNENLKSLVVDLFGAGTETVANTLRWAILLMMKYPEIQRPLRAFVMTQCHDNPAAGHFGFFKTLHLVTRTFWWPRVRHDVHAYVTSCVPCRQAKAATGAPPGLLQPLPTPNRPWGAISMDFLTDLPPSSGFTTVLVVVDMLTKMAHFIPCRGLPTAAKMEVEDAAHLPPPWSTGQGGFGPRSSVHSSLLEEPDGRVGGAGVSVVIASSGDRRGYREGHRYPGTVSPLLHQPATGQLGRLPVPGRVCF